MFIVYITLGIISGILTAIVTFASGAGLLMAIAAYVVGGIVGVSAGALWFTLSRYGFARHPSPAAHPSPQRIPQSRYEQ